MVCEAARLVFDEQAEFQSCLCDVISDAELRNDEPFLRWLATHLRHESQNIEIILHADQQQRPNIAVAFAAVGLTVVAIMSAVGFYQTSIWAFQWFVPNL